jgi:hypothetical protein
MTVPAQSSAAGIQTGLRRRRRHLVLGIVGTIGLTAGTIGLGPLDDPPPPPPTDPASGSSPTADDIESPPPPRVHLWVDRYEEIGGEVVEEDHELIVIRTTLGEIRTFSKGRLTRIIRLIDVEDPRPGMVELRDGSVLLGELVSDGHDEVVMRIRGVLSRFPRESVVQCRLDLTLEQKYRRARELMEPDAWLRRFELADWLFDERAYELARQELREIVAGSQLPEAVELLRIVEAQISMKNGSLASKRSIERPGDDDDAGPVDLRDMLPKEIISSDDVNIMRVYEIDFRNPPTRIHVSPETIRELLEKYGADKRIPADSAGRTRLFRADPLELVDLMFKLKARDMYSRIEVLSEPPSLNLFRQKVHDAWLIPNCATSQCHGGLDGGRFFLHRRGSKSERVRYTNLLILERWNELDMPLIDFDDPGRSLLIQYALPRNEARFPHPDVKGWKPAFTPSNQRLLRDSLRWIDSMYRPRPGYPIDFDAPVLSTPSLPDPFADGPDDAGDGRRDR